MIKANDITKSFGPLQVLNGIDLTVGKGEIVSIVGKSGAGKTTLLHILGSLDKPDSGSVTLASTDITQLKDRESSDFRNPHIGFVPHPHHLLPELPALENVTTPALTAGIPNSKARCQGLELLDFLNLADRAKHKPNELSGGEKQRVAVARALINHPDVIFADEPSGSLDSANKQDLHQLFFSLRDQMSQTFVIVTHDESLAALSDRTIRMADGRILV